MLSQRPRALHATFVAAEGMAAASRAFPSPTTTIACFFPSPLASDDTHTTLARPCYICRKSTTDDIPTTAPARPSSPAGGRLWPPRVLALNRQTQTTPSSSPTLCAPVRPPGYGEEAPCTVHRPPQA